VADTSVVDLDANLVRLWGSDFDVLDGEVFASLPGYCGLAGHSLFVVVSFVSLWMES